MMADVMLGTALACFAIAVGYLAFPEGRAAYRRLWEANVRLYLRAVTGRRRPDYARIRELERELFGGPQLNPGFVPGPSAVRLVPVAERVTDVAYDELIVCLRCHRSERALAWAMGRHECARTPE